MQPPSSIQLQSAQLLERFASASPHGFDRLLAQRLIFESQRREDDGRSVDWLGNVIECGESLNLRIRRVRCPLAEVLQLASDRVPIATLLGEASQPTGWLLIDEQRNGRWRCLDLSNGNTVWRSQRELEAFLRQQDRVSTEWLYSQQILLTDEADYQAMAGLSPRVEGGKHPCRRLWQFLKPDRGDLWIILLFSLVVGLLTLTTPIAVEALVNTVAFGRYLQPVIILALIVLVFLSFSATLTALNTYVIEVIQRRLFVRLVDDLAFRLPRVNQNALDHSYPPEIVNRFLDIVIVQKSVAKLLSDGLSLVLLVIIGMSILGFYHPFLLGYDLALLAIMVFTLFVLGRGAMTTAIKESKAKHRMTAWLQEIARHPTAFRLNHGMDFAVERTDQLAVTYLDARKKHFRIVMRQVLFALGTYVVATTVLLGLGGYLVIAGQLSLGQLVAAELIVLLILTSFAKLGKHLESFYDLLAAMDKIGQLLDLPLQSHEAMFHLPQKGAAELNLHRIKYAFPGNVLFDGMSCTVPAGASLAIWGRHGTGKSFLADFCCGLRQPDDGNIELDGIDLREIRPDLVQQQIALARGVEIFAGSIAENIHLNRSHVTAADVRETIAWLGLEEDLAELPEGSATILQTNGFPLSSGQCQKLMIARALVGQPRVVILDGSLDMFDAGDARRVIERIHRSGRFTLLVMTKREDIARACERIVKLEKLSNSGFAGKTDNVPDKHLGHLSN